LKTCDNPTSEPPTQAAAQDFEAFAQFVFPPAESCGLNIKDTILYSLAFSALLRVFVLADAGESSFMGFNPVQMEKWKTRSHNASGFDGGLSGR
jgi:hypothetical protein